MYMHPKEIGTKYLVDQSEYEDSDRDTQEMWDRKYSEAATNRHTDTHYGGKTKYESRNSLLANIKKHGVKEPVSIRSEDNVIEDGYHRLAVAKEHNLIVPIKYDNS
jgi:ParB-like chromosome segregation protein Spo0J